MKDIVYLSSRMILIFISATLCACVVVPKKVASYDKKCMVSTQKIELTMEQAEIFDDANCTNNDCEIDLMGDIASSALLTTTSAIVSGSIALVGNTLYWLESHGECPNVSKQGAKPVTEQETTNDMYVITEEIIPAKS